MQKRVEAGEEQQRQHGTQGHDVVEDFTERMLFWLFCGVNQGLNVLAQLVSDQGCVLGHVQAACEILWGSQRVSVGNCPSLCHRSRPRKPSKHVLWNLVPCPLQPYLSCCDKKVPGEQCPQAQHEEDKPYCLIPAQEKDQVFGNRRFSLPIFPAALAECGRAHMEV